MVDRFQNSYDTFHGSCRLDRHAYTSLPICEWGHCSGGICMELYESLFIIRPTLSDEETTTLIEK